jgi:hypothetical protein
MAAGLVHCAATVVMVLASQQLKSAMAATTPKGRPIRRNFSGCCARATSGHANAFLQRAAMKVRHALLITIGPSNGGSRALDHYER